MVTLKLQLGQCSDPHVSLILSQDATSDSFPRLAHVANGAQARAGESFEWPKLTQETAITYDVIGNSDRRLNQK